MLKHYFLVHNVMYLAQNILNTNQGLLAYIPNFTKLSKLHRVGKGNIAKFVVSCCAFCKLQRKFGFLCSVNHLSGPLRKQMFNPDWCMSIYFVCFFVSRFTACDRPVSGNDQLVFFEVFMIFRILVS